MVQWQLKSNRKVTGGLLRRHMKKKKYQRGRDFVPAHIGDTKKSKIRTKGGNEKTVMFLGNVANVSVDGKFKKAKILSVSINKANLQFTRRNIITKGAILETDIGKVRVTSRPGQHGFVNAVLV